jgi:hypothetical protein
VTELISLQHFSLVASVLLRLIPKTSTKMPTQLIGKELYCAGTLLHLLSSELKHMSGSKLEGKTMGLQSGRPWVLRAAGIILVVGVLRLTSFAQQPKVLAPHQPIPPRVPKSQELPLPPAVPGSLVGGPWMIDANFKSTLYIKNVVETSSVTVTPILYLSNGAKFALPSVTLEPAGTATVDVNSGLQSLGIASFATLSGYVEIQYNWPWIPICAMIRNLDTVHSLVFVHTTQPLLTGAASGSAQTFEGMWWKQEANVTGFVALMNPSSQPITAAVQISDNQGTQLAAHSVTVSPNGTKVMSLQELQSLT